MVGHNPPVSNSASAPNMPSSSWQNMFHSSLIDLLIHQQALQKDTTVVISTLPDLQTLYKNDHILVDMHTYNGEGDKPLTNWITKVEKIVHSTQQPELQLTWAESESIVYKLVEGIPLSSKQEMVKKRICQVFSPIATKMHATTRIHSQPQAANETLQEYIQLFTNLVIQTTDNDLTAMTCQMRTVLFIRHLLNKKKWEAVSPVKTIQTLKACNESSPGKWRSSCISTKAWMTQFVRYYLQCQTINLQTPNYIQLHLEVLKMSMDFISMDLIGPFEITSKGISTDLL